MPQHEQTRYCLNGDVISNQPLVVRTAGDEELELSAGQASETEVAELVRRLAGGCTQPEVEHILPRQSSESVRRLLASLENYGVIRPLAPAEGQTGMQTLLEIEDLSNQLLYRTLYRNEFWVRCQNAAGPGDIPERVFHGMVIENYHFLFRESYFDAPVLSYVPNTRVRLAMNAFFAEEYGHDELLLQALNRIGVSREDLAHTVPLPQTMALCNALAYWSHNDPLFFFTTLGILEGKDIRQDSFLDAAYRLGVDEAFLKPVKAHSDINLKGEHGSLTRQIFSQIDVVDLETARRLRAQTHLFVELYDAFYSAVWRHYSGEGPLLRRIENY
ncbi:iron-containing redox enzyme family protein [Chromobacterium vaccinii]|uniref:iron-containing redox enzyme family protein n=1 Tax=Chromobacterium TaxID=535 RepID=UPI0018F23742|nr:iron-containing redox enzyme family protein [Chromobacterium sp. ATCC 53434]